MFFYDACRWYIQVVYQRGMENELIKIRMKKVKELNRATVSIIGHDIRMENCFKLLIPPLKCISQTLAFC